MDKNHPWLVTLHALAVLAGAIIAMPFFGRAFLPEFNEGTLTISAVTLPGPSLARHGLSVRSVARTLEAAVQGAKASRVLEGQNAFDLVVRLTDGDSSRMDEIGGVLVDTAGGAKVPMAELARIIKDTGPNTVSREQVERKRALPELALAEADIRARNARVDLVKAQRIPDVRVEFLYRRLE